MKIPKEFQDALLYAVTPEKKCVGIKIFAESDSKIEFDSTGFECFIDLSVKSAIELKTSIENGQICDINKNKQIISNPIDGKYTDSEFLIRTRLNGKYEK